AHDYRYFPEPDLPPLSIGEDWIERVRKNLPELPAPRRTRFIEQYRLSEYDAGMLSAERDLADYFEAAAKQADPKKIANWICTELLREIKKDARPLVACPLRPEALAELVRLIDDGR